MSNSHYQQQLAELEELARETTNLLDDIVTEEEYSVIEPDISDLDDRDPIPDEEWFPLCRTQQTDLTRKPWRLAGAYILPLAADTVRRHWRTSQ